MTPSPLTDAEFAAALDPLLDAPGPLAVAVSGGRDSLALMHLAARYCAERGRTLFVLTVDHGLRAESAREAVWVGDAAAALGLNFRILTWRDPPRGNLEAAAREARYRLMAEACTEAGFETLLLGHTEDDQAETVLLRLARGSGVDGLSAMAPRSRRLGLTLLRPLLDIPRARLEARLKAEGIAWLDDPMNEDSRFSRVQIRRAQGLLAKVGLTPARLAQTARHMARVRRALEAAVDTLGAEAAPLAPEGYARLDPARLLAAPDEIGHRLFARLLMRIGGRGLPPRFDSLQRLYGLVRTGGLVRGKTLGGCRILPRSDGALLILREASPAPLILVPGRTLLWDGRFRVQLPANAFLDAPPLLRALGADGIHALRKASPGTRLNDLPGPVRASLPSLWIHQEPAAIPHLNYVAAGAPPPIHGFTARFDGF